MTYYTSMRTVECSPKYTYFDSVEELNTYYGLDSTIEKNYNNGYSFMYNNTTAMMFGYDD